MIDIAIDYPLPTKQGRIFVVDVPAREMSIDTREEGCRVLHHLLVVMTLLVNASCIRPRIRTNTAALYLSNDRRARKENQRQGLLTEPPRFFRRPPWEANIHGLDIWVASDCTRLRIDRMVPRCAVCCLDWNSKSSLTIFEYGIDEGLEDALNLNDHGVSLSNVAKY